MENNNNKRKLDGRKSNKRKDRIKIIKSDNLPAPKGYGNVTAVSVW